MQTFDVETAIAEAVTAHHATAAANRAKHAAEEQQRQQQQAAKHAQAIAAFEAQVRADLGAELYTALATTVVWSHSAPQATVQIDGETWTITQATKGPPWWITRPSRANGGAERAALRSVLLRCIAHERELRAQQQAEQEQQEAERLALLAEHERCTALRDEALAAAQR